MATNDNRRVIQAAALDLQKVNTALAQISNWIMSLEGRSGEVKLRDSLIVQSEKQTLIDFETEAAGKASIAVFGTDNATLALAKGSRKEDNGEWIATDTVSVIWALDRSGSGTLYANTGLTVGQAFTPTTSAVIGTGGSYVLKTGDTMTGDLNLDNSVSGGPNIRIINRNADTTGPGLFLNKFSASPAAGDSNGSITFRANNSTPTPVTTGYIQGLTIDPTAGSEDLRIDVALITAGSLNDPGCFTGSTAGSTSPAIYAYFKPIAAKFKADTASAGTAVWDTTIFDSSGGKIVTQASSTQIKVTEAGQYRVGSSVCVALAAATGANFSLIRYNSGGTLQDQNVCTIYNGSATTAAAISAVHSTTFNAAANDYFLVTWDAGTIVAADVYNNFSIERLN